MTSLRLTFFSFLFGVFLVLHFSVYAFRYSVPLYVTTWLVLVGGLLLMLRSADHRLWLLLLPLLIADGWLHMPIFSNHTILKNFLLLGMLLAGIYSLFRRDGWDAWFDRFAPIGRVLLLTMYFFGVFHKINHDFIDPSVSCAVTLWSKMPWPLYLVDGVWFHYLAIYGTWIIETIIFFMLLIAPLRKYGVIVGILFHMLLALSGYAFYAAFSSLAIALHALFLTNGEVKAMASSETYKKIKFVLKRPSIWVLVSGLVLMMCLNAWLGNYHQVGILLLVFLLPLVVVYAKSIKLAGYESQPFMDCFVSRPLILNIIPVVFFLNCVAPYLGLKTAQSMNMFANLRLEAGVSNHIILSRPPGPFGYLDDVVIVKEAMGSEMLRYVASEGLAVTYYSLLDQISRYPQARVSFFRNNELVENAKHEELSDDINELLHPLWFRKWFHFNPVDLTEPKPCAPNR